MGCSTGRIIMPLNAQNQQREKHKNFGASVNHLEGN